LSWWVHRNSSLLRVWTVVADSKCLIVQATELVEKSTGIEKSMALAIGQAELACQAAMQLAPSPARDALVRLAQLVVYRSK
jgi:geranylgeranyl pyrophosphate synthase